ncbi:Hypothetical predicted protein [Prunus dulcis]|nr:Hypothetical predicted protein [Prunus dulcis]
MERRFYNFLFRVVNIEAEHCRSLQEEAIRCKGVMCSFEKFEDRVEGIEPRILPEGVNTPNHYTSGSFAKESRFKDEDVTKTGGGIQSLLTVLFGGWSTI